MHNGAEKHRRYSIHDVAARAGVSAATVSKIMRGVSTVRAENVAKVNQAVADLGYRVDPLASDLRRAKRRIIAAIVPELESEFFGKMVSALERLVEQRGYALVVTTSRESEARECELIDRMSDWRVSGIILAPVNSELGAGAERLKHYAMSAVLIDRVHSADTHDTVSSDSVAASAEVANELVKAGHKHVLLLGLSSESANVQHRIGGFRTAALAQCPNMKIDVVLADGDIGRLRDALSEYFAQTMPSAIYSLFQKGTLVALTELRRRNCHCPGDISLIGFDDAGWMQATYPAISAVVQPVQEIAALALRQLFGRIDGSEVPARAHVEPCKVVMRESVGPPRGGPH